MFKLSPSHRIGFMNYICLYILLLNGCRHRSAELYNYMILFDILPRIGCSVATAHWLLSALTELIAPCPENPAATYEAHPNLMSQIATSNQPIQWTHKEFGGYRLTATVNAG